MHSSVQHANNSQNKKFLSNFKSTLTICFHLHASFRNKNLLYFYLLTQNSTVSRHLNMFIKELARVRISSLQPKQNKTNKKKNAKRRKGFDRANKRKKFGKKTKQNSSKQSRSVARAKRNRQGK